MTYTFRTRKGNYHSVSLTLFAIPAAALVIALAVSVAAAVMEARYQSYFETAKEAIVSGQTSVTLKSSFLSKLAVKRAAFSTPELFCVNSYRYVERDNTTYYTFNINNYALDYEANLKRFNEAVDSIAASAPEFQDDRETVKWIHDYIIENYSYDYSLSSENALSMIDTGSGTCQGYTALFGALAERFGIEYGVKTNYSHTWNVVKLGFRWYHVDVTWDDKGKEPGYDYFLKESTEFLKSHTGWEDTGVSLTVFENLRNSLFFVSAVFFLVITAFTALPVVLAYFKK